MQHRNQFVQTPQVQLYVKQLGERGDNLVVVHGGPDWDHSYFLPFIEPLAATHRLTFFDLRGCGRSQKLGNPSLYHLNYAVEDLKHLLDQLTGHPVTLLGFSYGGQVALRFLSRYPDYVERLILASTTAYLDFQSDLEAWREYQQRNNSALRERVRQILASEELTDEQRTTRLAYTTLPLDVFDEEKLELAKKVIGKIHFSGEWMRALRDGYLKDDDQRDYQSLLKSLGIPTLVLHGEKDMRFPASVAERLADACPNVRLALVPAAGHLAHIEKTKAWNEKVDEFLWHP
jgi:proline-specific peptidase